MNNTETFLQSVKKYHNILIIISGSPDPDAIASAYAIKILLSTVSINSDIVITKKISLSQNRAFVKYLKIPVNYSKILRTRNYDAYIVPDFQSNIVDGVTNHIPCAAHIDHHTETENRVYSDFSLIRPDSGSTSSLVAMMIKECPAVLGSKELVPVSTALMFGIQTDTDKYEHATPVDIEALHFLSEYSDKDLINKLSGIPISPVTMRYYKRASLNHHAYKDWNIYGTGYIDIEHRDSIAIAADLFLKKPGNANVIVYGIVEDRERDDLFLDVSFRSKSSTLDLDTLIKRISPSGGGRMYKGAYQVNLGYFRICPDRDLLIKIVESTTIERLKKARDSIHIREITPALPSALKRAASFFKK